jgi:CheY-like chemotaxis protein
MKRLSGAAIVRHQVFMLADGTYVVQWDDKRVQELLTGEYREYDHQRDFGHAITDHELKQLKVGGRVEHYTRQYVWLNSLPERGRFANRRVLDRGYRVRVYYLNTTLPESQLSAINRLIFNLNLEEHFQAVKRSGLVVVMRSGEHAFPSLEDAEEAQQLLTELAPDLFTGLEVAFTEIDPRHPTGDFQGDETPLNLDDIIASQQDTGVTAGKRVVLAVNEPDERAIFRELIDNLKIEVLEAASGSAALELLEDNPTDLLIMDVQLNDMHAYQILGKAREIAGLRELPVIVITNEPNMSMTIARVDYLLRPVSVARLRHNIWKVLHDHDTAARLPSKPTRNPTRSF